MKLTISILSALSTASLIGVGCAIVLYLIFAAVVGSIVLLAYRGDCFVQAFVRALIEILDERLKSDDNRDHRIGPAFTFVNPKRRK